ncbi:hypothetical protein DAMA08_012540 [Martiniozyma asiatica (nom. inval.)]|nr:hypothetical protein DAMA08_012540 [Martiniozyma asiatica]
MLSRTLRTATRSLHSTSALFQVNSLVSTNEFTKVVESGKPVFVDFFATWCGPCKMIAPVLDKFSNETDKVDFYKLDVDDENVRPVVMDLGITAMPTFIAFKDGKEFGRIVGADPRQVKALVDAVGN